MSPQTSFLYADNAPKLSDKDHQPDYEESTPSMKIVELRMWFAPII